MLQRLDHLAVFPDNASWQECVTKELERWCFQLECLDDPFIGNYPPANTALFTADDVEIGTAPFAGPIGCPFAQEAGLNTLLLGPSGTGKTTLLQVITKGLSRNCCVIAIDRKRQLRDLLTDADVGNQVNVLDLTDCFTPLYERLPGVPLEVSLTDNSEIIGRSTGRIYAQRLLPPAVRPLLEQCAVGEGVAIDEVINAVEKMRVRGYRQIDNKESILTSLHYIKSPLGDQLNCRRSTFRERLFNTHGLTIIEVSTLPEDLYAFSVLRLTRPLYLQRLFNPEARHNLAVVALDDATAAIDPAVERYSVTGTSPLSEEGFMGRGLNLGHLYVAHMIPADKISHNCRNVFVTSGQGDDPRFLRHRLGLNDEQIEGARVLPTEQVIALIPSKHPKAFPIRVEPLPLGRATEAQCRASAQAFMANVVVERYSPPQDTAPTWTSTTDPSRSAPTSGSRTSTPTKPDGLDEQSMKAVLAITDRLPPTLTELYDRCGDSRRQARKIVRKIETFGLVRRLKLATGKPGRPMTLVLPTDAAWLQLIRRGLGGKPRTRINGGVEHELTAASYELICKHAGDDLEFEVTSGPVRFDAQRRDKNGACTFIQIGASDVQREADALVRAATIPQVRLGRVELITRDHTFARKTLKLVKDRVGDPCFIKNITPRLLGEVILEAKRVNGMV
ncbi:MAG: hypothetical protein IT445_18135 [Phycisphaeraceae bacterium]|nr:hypothetical protein [Phycisphaeraceae bacterium]